MIAVAGVDNDGSVVIGRYADRAWIWRPGRPPIQLRAPARPRYFSGNDQWPGGVSWSTTGDGAGPAVFGRVSASGTPVAGMLIAGLLTTGLIALNYTRDLVGLFTFIILLSTLSTLVPYVFSSLALFLLPERGREALPRGIAAAAILAFAYSLWAMAGAGAETIYWGFLLLIAGLPVYVFLVRRSSA